MRTAIDNKHRKNIREEIIAHIEESFRTREGEEEDEAKVERHVRAKMNNSRITIYILEQTEAVFNGLLNEEDPELRPDNMNPDTVERDYYRESIEEYATVYTDYPVE
jgi:ethanolamine utilization protein EutQ (cupin superfamily)